MRDRLRDRDAWVHGLIQLAGRGRPWWANKVFLVMWPGAPKDYDTVQFAKFKAVPFATHLEAGFFIDMHPRGWSYITVISKTHCFDLTSKAYR